MANRKPKTIHFWRGKLPHWQVEDGRYFVTIHLKDAIPEPGQLRIRELASESSCCSEHSIQPNSSEENNLRVSRMIFREMEKWLDCSSPVAHLGRVELAEMIVEAINHRANKRIWEMFRYAVMPSHLHLFFELADELSLKRELEEFKRWTGHQASKIDRQFVGNRFWQTEWFDHWSRSDEQDVRICKYIRQNPLKAGLVRKVEDWKYFG